MSTIVPLTQGHCPKVARLHLDHLRTGFRGRPGLELLAAYYRILVQSGGGCGYVAEQAGQVAGYVCGVWEPAAVRGALLRAEWPALLWWGWAQVLVRPRFLHDLLGRLRESSSRRATAAPGYELRPIVVAPGARGTGIATQLVDVLLGDARRRGFDRVYLVVDVDNTIANAFYRKVGFRPSGSGGGPSVSRQRYEYLLSSL